MSFLFSILVAGFALGMRHATDADHVVAVTTIISRERSPWRAAGLGLVWGLGHTVTIVAVGGAILGLGWVVPQRLGLGLDFSVGIMLVALGAWRWRGIWGEAQAIAPPVPAPAGGRRPGPGLLRPLVVGIVHGLAGSVALALLFLPLIQIRLWAMIYLLVFGIGTVAGMMLITAAMVLPFRWSAARSAAVNRGLGRAAALASVGLGIFLLYDIGIVQGLLVR